MTLLVYTLVLMALGAVYVSGRPCSHVEEQYVDPALGSLKDCQKLWGRRFLEFMKDYCPELYKCWMQGSITDRPGTLSTSRNMLQPTIQVHHIHHIHHLVYLVVVPAIFLVLLAAFIIWKRRRRGQTPMLYIPLVRSTEEVGIVDRNDSHQ